MRILVLAGETADLGPRSTLLGLCRALRSSVAELELATSLRDETDEDPPPPVLGLQATYAAARRSHLVLLTNDAVTPLTLHGAVLLQALDWTRAMTGGVALLEDSAGSRAVRWLRAHSLRRLGVFTAANERSVHSLSALGLGTPDLLPDPALLVPAAFADASRAALAAAGAPCDGSPLIGLAPRHIKLHDQTREASDARLVNLLARALDLAIERHDAFVVCLPASGADATLCSAITATMRSPRRCVAPELDPGTFKGIASELAILVSMHRRAALLAVSVGRPTIGLSDSAALTAALERTGAGHACLDASLFLRGSLLGQLGELIDTALETRRTPVLRFEELRASVRSGIRSLIEICN